MSVLTAHVVSPCQLAVDSFGVPASRPAAYPPASAARMPATANHIAAPNENEEAEGVSPVDGSRVAAPIPMPSMLRSNCVTSVITTPASTAAQEILLIIIVRTSSAELTGDTCGAS